MDEEKKDWIHRDEYEFTVEKAALWLSLLGRTRGDKKLVHLSPTPESTSYELARLIYDVERGRNREGDQAE